ncbi:5722_t:CDS:2, partial [Gigaspora margarita]
NISDITPYEHAINYYYEKKYNLAVEILREIAKNGEKLEYKNQAKFVLALCYEFGNGVTKDFKKAFNIFLELSNSQSHNTEVKDCLAKYYFVSWGMKKDINKSYELYLELSKTESDQQYSAKLMLAKFYLHGWGVVKRNQKKAFELFSELLKSKLYEQNSAKYLLASCYENGEGVTKDVNKACQLYLDLSKTQSLI